MATATLEAIRDRMITLVTSISPSIRSDIHFRHSQDEGDGDFQAWAESNPAGAFRRFQVREEFTDGVPVNSLVDLEQHDAKMIITIAYPYDKKAGPQGARDRRDAMDSDWGRIYTNLGPIGRVNYSGTNDCTPYLCEKTIDDGDACEFLVVTISLMYLRSFFLT